MRSALRAGMTLAEFWDATITETLMVIQAFRWRMEEQQRTALWQAWSTAALAGANFSKSGMPPLSKVLPKEKRSKPRPLGPEREAVIWKAWAQDHNMRFRKTAS